MITSLNSQQTDDANRMNRSFTYTGGFAAFLNDVLAGLASGATGIASAGVDVDSLALGGGGAFSVNWDLSAGLTLAYYPGRMYAGGQQVSVPAGSLALVASSVNYVEVDQAGNVSRNTAGFTGGRCPLYVVTTGVASYAPANVANAKLLLSWTPPGSVAGALLSATAATRAVRAAALAASLAAAGGAVTLPPVRVPCGGRVTAATLLASAAVGQDDGNYWSVSVVDLGQGGAGTQPITPTPAAAANSTRLTGGAAVAANACRPLTLATLVNGSELNVQAGDVLSVTLTPTGSPPPLANVSVSVDVQFAT